MAHTSVRGQIALNSSGLDIYGRRRGSVEANAVERSLARMKTPWREVGVILNRTPVEVELLKVDDIV